MRLNSARISSVASVGISIILGSPGVKCNEVSKRMLNAKITQLKNTVSNYQKLITLMSEILPMIETSEDYYCNKAEIDEFINQIYKDIRGEN